MCRLALDAAVLSGGTVKFESLKVYRLALDIAVLSGGTVTLESLKVYGLTQLFHNSVA